MASEIFEEFGAAFQVLLVPSQGGVFEVEVDGDRVYSKRDIGRHADYGTDVAPRLRGVPSSG